MWSNALAERLEDEPIVLSIDGGRLDVRLGQGAPAGYVLPPALKDAIVSEAKQIGRRASDVQHKLDEIARGRSVKMWQRFHDHRREYRHWPEAVGLVTPYAYLCSWADAHRHIAEAQQVIKQGTAPAATIGGRRADLSFYSQVRTGFFWAWGGTPALHGNRHLDREACGWAGWIFRQRLAH
jgi:hypothetical protein